ncbi:hypothetical protein C3F09_00310 [candidate division GN15 bacterium]|uniref:Uncharacterized protein n=1 Tax=candidate division GN15 bacterium TaxID=2072418 RepID=A0A855XDE8_9BACT|nr:MAG: hypothetical protein C3F09_00310 [candidate division GN15 bacterium]
MKKIVIGFLLIVALIAVSYYNATRSDSRAKKEYQGGYDKGAHEAAIQKSRADSLDNALKQEKSQFDDSLQILALAHDNVVDSLNRTIASKDKEIAAARAASRKQTTRKSNGPTQGKVTSSGVTHAQILDYYRRKLGELPADLSPYERTVAVAEIRDQTSRKFSISAQDFQKIRDANKLTE